MRIFGRTESWLAGVKVVAIVAFFLLGAAAMVGLLPLHDGSAAPFFSELTADGWYGSGDIVVRRPDGNLVVHGREHAPDRCMTCEDLTGSTKETNR